jgi:hypothetical protein
VEVLVDPKVKSKIRESFVSGLLRVRSVRPDGKVVVSVVSDVLKHQSSSKGCIDVILSCGSFVTTTLDHSLFKEGSATLTPCASDSIGLSDRIAIVSDNTLSFCRVSEVRRSKSRSFTYDLSVPEFENFVLSNGIVAHNSYSIGGVSLDLDKSSKYESLKQGASDQFDKQLERAKLTVKVVKGLQQPKYGAGIRSSLGPYVGRGVLSPAKFLGV